MLKEIKVKCISRIVDPMSISLLLVSLNLNFVTKIKVAMCFFLS